MFDFLTEQKDQVDRALLAYAVSDMHVKTKLATAKQTGKSFISSPTGLCAAFGLGALKGSKASTLSAGTTLISALARLD